MPRPPDLRRVHPDLHGSPAYDPGRVADHAARCRDGLRVRTAAVTPECRPDDRGGGAHRRSRVLRLGAGPGPTLPRRHAPGAAAPVADRHRPPGAVLLALHERPAPPRLTGRPAHLAVPFACGADAPRLTGRPAHLAVP